MKSYRSLAALAAVVLMASWGVVACKKPAPAPEPPPPAAPAPAPAPAGLQVSDVQLGTAIGADRQVTAPTAVFKPSDTIYAAVVTTGSAPTATITARFTYQDGQVVSESSQQLSGAGVTEFHISKPDGWPACDYTLDVLLDGKGTGTKAFKVQA
jgi:hypothetical protein